MDTQQPGNSADPYSFDAPSHVMQDFNSEDNADQWFGKLTRHLERFIFVITSCLLPDVTFCAFPQPPLA